jgi:hypothetical protein
VLAVLLRPVLHALDVGLAEYLRELRTPVLASLVMAAVAMGVTHFLDLPNAWILAIKVVLGAACHLALVMWWDGNPFFELRRLLADTRAGATLRGTV